MPTLTFDPTAEQTPATLKPLYTDILSHSATPTQISLGAVTTAAAQAWLLAQHAAYCQALGERRSPLIQKMDILKRVQFVGLTDAPPP